MKNDDTSPPDSNVNGRVINEALTKNSRLRLTKKKLAITKYLGRHDLTYKQIADLVGCSYQLVSQTSQLVKKEVGGPEVELESYRRSLRKKASEGHRSDCLGLLTDPKRALESPFSTIRAIEYVDRMLGLHPEVRKQEETAQPQQQPMFIMPSGTNVQVNVFKRGEVVDEAPNQVEIEAEVVEKR